MEVASDSESKEEPPGVKLEPNEEGILEITYSEDEDHSPAG